MKNSFLKVLKSVGLQDVPLILTQDKVIDGPNISSSIRGNIALARQNFDFSSRSQEVWKKKGGGLSQHPLVSGLPSA
eukprot:UN21062